MLQYVAAEAGCAYRVVASFAPCEPPPAGSHLPSCCLLRLSAESHCCWGGHAGCSRPLHLAAERLTLSLPACSSTRLVTPLPDGLPRPSARAVDFGLAWRAGTNDSVVDEFDRLILALQEDGTMSQVWTLWCAVARKCP